MDTHGMQPPPHHQAVIDRFVAACRADARVVAAFLGGSYASGTADAYSDLDLGLITADAAHDDFLARREEFIRRLGEPVFLEDFDRPDNVFFILTDGTEGELALGRAGRFAHIHAGPYRVLLDERGILAGAVFPGHAPGRAEQREAARRLVYWFWHDLSHFIAAMGRGQLWWAHGQLETLRRCCVDLLRLRQDGARRPEGYDKVDAALPAERLAPLRATYCPLEYGPMLQAGRGILGVYREVAPALAAGHGIRYPVELERLMTARLDHLGAARANRSPGKRRTGRGTSVDGPRVQVVVSLTQGVNGVPQRSSPAACACIESVRWTIRWTRPAQARIRPSPEAEDLPATAVSSSSEPGGIRTHDRPIRYRMVGPTGIGLIDPACPAFRAWPRLAEPISRDTLIRLDLAFGWPVNSPSTGPHRLRGRRSPRRPPAAVPRRASAARRTAACTRG